MKYIFHPLFSQIIVIHYKFHLIRMIHFSEQYSQMITRELKFNIINVSNVNFIFLLYFSFNYLNSYGTIEQFASILLQH